MNDPDESLPDELLSDLLKPLRETKIPATAQRANRQAISRALAKQARPRWWQRSIAVPVPVAIAATIVLVFTTVALLRPSSAEPELVRDAPQLASIPNHEISSEVAPAIPIRTAPAWHVTQSYIHSLTTVAGPTAFVESFAKENRNDS